MIDQGELFTIPNPCKGVCTSNSRGYCRGCLRSRQERFHWNDLTQFQQQLIVNLCEKRRLKIIAAREGLSDDEDFGEAPDQQDLFLIPAEEQTEAPSPEVPPPSHTTETVRTPVKHPGDQFDLF